MLDAPSAPSHSPPGSPSPSEPPPNDPALAASDAPPGPPDPPPSSGQLSRKSDPHASKLSPDDPRLRIRSPRGRTLRKGPAIALVVGVAGLLVLSLVFALIPSPKSSETKKQDPEPPPAATPAPVPDSIRNRPEPASDGPLALPLADAGAPVNGGPGQAPSARGGRTGRDPRTEQDLHARGAGILFDATRGGAPTAPTSSFPPPAPAPGGSAASARPLDADPNLQERKNAFLDSIGASRNADYLPTQLQHPRSPYEVKAGTIIPAVLITAVNSDLPGPVIGQVRENVYDTVSGNHLLIPQGARILAQYDSMVAWGQERVLVCWNRLIFPNGDSLSLECMPAADLAGAAGLTDEVDEHWNRIIKGAAVASLLAATTTTVAGNTEGYNPTVPQTFARNSAGEVNQVGQRITARNLNIQPTITVRPGFSVNVIVSKDLLLPRPYPVERPPRRLGP